MDRMELQKVNTDLDDDSNSGDSIEDGYSKDLDSEKATINSQYVEGDDAESQKFLTNGIGGKKKLDEYADEHHPGTTSFGMSVFNLSNAIMGSGILGLSYAMANTGIILFVVLLLGVAILSLYSVHLLLKTAKEGGSLIYEKLGEKAFGWPGKYTAFVSITMQNIGAMSSYLFIVKYELPEVIKTFMRLEENTGEWYLNGNYLVIFVSIGVILPLSMLKNLGYLGYTSGFSLSCMVFFVSVVIYKKTQIPCPLPLLDPHHGNLTSNNTYHLHPLMIQNYTVDSGVNFMMDYNQGETAGIGEHKDNTHGSGVEFEAHTDEKCKPKLFVFNSQTAYAIPILAFAFVCHPEVLPIYSELKSRSRRKMQTVSNLSITAMLVMYLFAALFGYLTFFGEVQDELLHTYTKVYRFDTLLLCVRLAVLVAVTLTVPIVLFPIRSSLTTLLFPGRPFSLLRHFLIALILLAFNNTLVIFVPTIKDIFGFIGASAATNLIFILPAAFYLRIVKKEPFRSPQKIGLSTIIRAVESQSEQLTEHLTEEEQEVRNSNKEKKHLEGKSKEKALVFLIVGVIFMIGSMGLIISDWIHNPLSSKHH